MLYQVINTKYVLKHNDVRANNELFSVVRSFASISINISFHLTL